MCPGCTKPEGLAAKAEDSTVAMASKTLTWKGLQATMVVLVGRDQVPKVDKKVAALVKISKTLQGRLSVALSSTHLAMARSQASSTVRTCQVQPWSTTIKFWATSLTPQRDRLQREWRFLSTNKLLQTMCELVLRLTCIREIRQVLAKRNSSWIVRRAHLSAATFTFKNQARSLAAIPISSICHRASMLNLSLRTSSASQICPATLTQSSESALLAPGLAMIVWRCSLWAEPATKTRGRTTLWTLSNRLTWSTICKKPMLKSKLTPCSTQHTVWSPRLGNSKWKRHSSYQRKCSEELPSQLHWTRLSQWDSLKTGAPRGKMAKSRAFRTITQGHPWPHRLIKVVWTVRQLQTLTWSSLKVANSPPNLTSSTLLQSPWLKTESLNKWTAWSQRMQTRRF